LDNWWQLANQDTKAGQPFAYPDLLTFYDVDTKIEQTSV